MVLVFHFNRRVIKFKVLCIISLLLFLLYIHAFEITYHYINSCPSEEPIDIVYTWVNGSDPRFLKELNSYLHRNSGSQIDSSSQRYDDKNELKFSLRSIEKFAPWVNHIYIVTNGQIPSWLNLDYEKVTVITHKDIFSNKYDLPSFSSPAIESQLHRIPAISKRFIYFNDDVFLQSPIYKDDFVSPSRGFLIYLAWMMPMCAPECSWLYVADGHCDSVCNIPNCQMDGGDCSGHQKTIHGDIIVTSDDYEVQISKDKPPNETNYQKILFDLQNSSYPRNFSVARNLRQYNLNNVSELIAEHNKKVILLDKLKRYKMKKRSQLDRVFSSRNLNRNVDAYAASLQHTNRVLNDYYGFSVRKVPAHAPIMIDRDMMAEMQEKFAQHFQRTTRNRFRSVNDLQFSFAYYYFVIHEKTSLTVEDIFNEFDTDLSGTWSEGELRMVLAKLYDLPINDDSLDQFANILNNCSKNFILSNLLITKEWAANCPCLASLLTKKFSQKHKYKFEIIRDSEKKYVSFKMLRSNITEVMNQLDDVRKKQKKFVCLNDNLDQLRTHDNQMIKRLMFDFYVSLFPVPSKFELPEYYRNRFLYMEDYVQMVNDQRKHLLFACVLFVAITVAIFLKNFRRKMCEIINQIFY